MAGYDIMPADPMGAAQEWQQTLAKTGLIKAQNTVAQSQARMAPLLEQKTQMEMAERQRQIQADATFRQKISELVPGDDPVKQMGEIARLAFESGDVAKAEAAIKLQAATADKLSRIDMRAAAADLRKAQESSLKLVRQQAAAKRVTSELMLESENLAYKQEFGEDLPFYKIMQERGIQWTPELGKSIQGKVDADLTEYQRRLLALREEAAGRGAPARAAAVAVAEARRQQIEARTEQIKKDQQQARKTDGKLVTMQPGDERVTKAAIRKAFPALAGDELELAVQTIGGAAKQQQRADTRSFAEALEKTLPAFMEDFKPKPGGLFSKDGTQFVPPGPDAERPGRGPAAGAKPSAAAPGLPKWAPTGSKLIGSTPEGKPVYQAPNGKKYVE